MPARIAVASLRSKLLLASVLVEVVMLALLVGNGIRLVQHHLERQTEGHVRAIELAYKTAVALPLASRDYATLRDILDGWSRAAEVRYLAVSDAGGRILAASGWPTDHPLPAPGQASDEGTRHIRFQVDYMGQVYGHVQYGLSTGFIDLAKRELLTQSLAIAGGEVFLTLFLLSVLGYWLTRHLAALMQASARVAEGDYRIRLDTGSGDEVAELADHFNRMAGEIESRIEALSRGEQRFRAIADYTYDWENWFTPDGRLTWVNPAVERVTGYSVAECQASAGFPIPLVHPEDRDLVRHCHEGGLAGQTGRDAEFRVRRKDGHTVWVAMSWQPIFDAEGHSLGYRSSIRDISQEHYAREELAYQARHDALTGLHNRRAFEARLQEVLDGLRRAPGRHCLLYIDLDQFKVVNDTCGHSAGDQLLREVTAIMATRQESGYLARLGGDEFGLLVPLGLDEAVRLGEQFIEAIHGHVFVHEGRRFRLGASIGVVEIRDASHSLDELLIAADQACYAAKDKGRDRIEVYARDDAYYRTQRAQFLSVSDINRALEEDRFVLHFQCIRPLRPGLPEHLEVLLRMIDPAGVLIAPAGFIPAAERFGLMVQLDRWVLDRVCRLLADRLIDDGTVVGVNLSGATLSDGDLIDFLDTCLVRYQVDPRHLCIEITETAAIANVEAAHTFIDAVRARGGAVALDDFGAGLSSFGYLRSLKANYLKIDGLFVRDLDQNIQDRAVVQAMVQVARVHGMATIAEYAHQPAIVEVLRELGVDYAQGYALHQPEPFTG